MDTLSVQEMITVLVVEDNPGDVRLVREILKPANSGQFTAGADQFTVIGADRLSQAIERLHEQHVDVILLDLSLPDATGLEAFRQMQAAAPNLPIIVLTGSYDETLSLQAVREGAQDYLLKQKLDSYLLARVLHYAIERNRADVALRIALAKEKELNELKSRFVSMVSHDFRTPLATIQSSSDLLSNYGYRMTEEKKAHHFNTIHKQIKHLTGLLEEMLNFGKAESVGLAFNPVLTDIRVFCQAIADEMQQLAGTSLIKVVINGQLEMVEIDTNLLRRALMNVLSNAVKYSPEGSVTEFRISGGKEQIVLCIQDHGIGIPQEEQSRLFEVFHRAKNVGDIPGTGLGLAIVKLAVEAHGGTITVDSQVNVGTSVTISIPLSRHNL